MFCFLHQIMSWYNISGRDFTHSPSPQNTNECDRLLQNFITQIKPPSPSTSKPSSMNKKSTNAGNKRKTITKPKESPPPKKKLLIKLRPSKTTKT